MRRITFYVMGASAVAAAVLGCTYVYEGKWGGFGSGNGQFDGPPGIAISPNANIYVADGGNDRIQYFNATGSFLGKWGAFGSGNGQFWHPTSVAVAPNGNVYVTDSGNDRIQYFTPTGSFLGKWGSPGSGNGQFESPRDVAIASNGNVYVVEWGYRVQYFTATGSFLGKWGSKGSGNGQFSAPQGIGIAPNGEVYVADASPNNRVSVFTASGGFLRHIGVGVLSETWDVGIKEKVFVSENGRSLVHYFALTGKHLGSFGGYGSGNGKFVYPEGLAISKSQRIYVADTANNRVQYFRAANPAVWPCSLGRVRALFN